MRFFGLPLLVLAIATGSFGCSEDSEPTTTGWQRLPDAPLSPRENAVGVWTGERTILVGGSDADPCPAFADCITPTKAPLRDGAAFDPVDETWTRIESAPVGFSGAQGLAMDGRVYIWSPGESGRPGSPQAFLSYDTAADRWSRLPLPPVRAYSSIVATGDEIIAFSLSDEGRSRPDFSFDPSTRHWTKLPNDPLPPSFDRTMAWSGSELLLLGKELGVPFKEAKPNLPQAASYNPETGEWRRLPRPDTFDQYATNTRWFPVDGLLINPAPGRTGAIPDGGIFDPETDQWLELPEAPKGVEEFAGTYGAGIIAGNESSFFGYEGWVLDSDDMSWIRIPRLEGSRGLTGGRTVVAAGEAMLVFGGVRYDPAQGGGQGRLLNEAWTWSRDRDGAVRLGASHDLDDRGGAPPPAMTAPNAWKPPRSHPVRAAVSSWRDEPSG